MHLSNFKRFSVGAQLSLFAVIILMFGVFFVVNNAQQQQETRTKASIPSSSAPALLQSNLGVFQDRTSDTVSFGTSVSTGSLLIVGITQYEGSVSSVTDNRGNTYVLAGDRKADSPYESVQLYYAKNAVGGATTVTVKFSATSDSTVGIYEYSGIDTLAPLDKVVLQNGVSRSPNGGTLTGTQDNELYFVVGLDDWADNSVPGAGDGYTLLHHQDEARYHERYYSEHRVSPKGSYQTNFSIGTSSSWAVIGATFKPRQVPTPTSTPVPTAIPTLTATLAPTAVPTVQPTQAACGGLVVASALKLDKTSVTFGNTITGQITYTNPCSDSISVKSVKIAGRNSNQGNADFSNGTGALTVLPGQMVAVQGSRVIATGDPVGLWSAFGSYQDANGVWHDNGAKVNFSVVNAITLIPTPTSTPVPTQAVPTTVPITIMPGNVYVGFTLLLDGIGNGGDRSNPDGKGNPDPKRGERKAVVEFFNDQNKLALTKTVAVKFDSGKGVFTAVVDLGTGIPAGLYTIKIKTDQYLKATVPGIQTISSGTVNNLPTTILVTGDINGDNQMNILDYNLLMGCYSDLLPAVSCDEEKKSAADITDDGVVNQYDYNLFLRELVNRGGD